MSDKVPTVDPGPRPELTWLPVDRLEVDPAYQRSLDSAAGKRLVRRIAGNFRWSAFQAVLAAPNGSEHWLVVDGQHRVAAAREIGLSLVPAVVIHGVDRAAQAVAFVHANRDRAPIPAQAVFHAQLISGNDSALTIKRLCDAAGITLLRYALPAKDTPAGKTTASPTLMKLLVRHGEAIVADAIATIGKCFGAERGGLRSIYFAAACRYLADGHSREELVRRVAAFKLGDLEAIVFGLGQETAIVEIMTALRRGAPAAARDVPKGKSWAFHEHPTQAEVAPLKVGPLPATAETGGVTRFDDPRVMAGRR